MLYYDASCMITQCIAIFVIAVSCIFVVRVRIVASMLATEVCNVSCIGLCYSSARTGGQVPICWQTSHRIGDRQTQCKFSALIVCVGNACNFKIC